MVPAPRRVRSGALFGLFEIRVRQGIGHDH
jgi:hypothetical protein